MAFLAVSYGFPQEGRAQAYQMAKNITRGYTHGFWKNHVLVLGVVSHVEPRDNKNYILRLTTERPTPACFPQGNVIEIKYEAAPNQTNANAGDMLHGLKEGDPILALLRPAFGGANLPNCVGESFAFMPKGIALYRVESEDDQNVIDTTNIATVCSIAELSERITAIHSLIEGRPTEHVKSFLAAYVESLVGRTESDLANARQLLKTIKNK